MAIELGFLASYLSAITLERYLIEMAVQDLQEAFFSLLIRGKKFKDKTPRKKNQQSMRKRERTLRKNPSNTFGFNLTCENAPGAVLFQSLLEVFC